MRYRATDNSMKELGGKLVRDAALQAHRTIEVY